LVVDRNEAFATMLEQMLTGEGDYQVQVAHNDSEALSLLQLTDFDLTILDMDLGPQGNYQGLIRRIRQHRPTMRVMLIPLMGQDLPPEASSLGIQGTLAKPFFVDDLLPSISDALSKNMRPSGPQPARQPAPEPATRPVSQSALVRLGPSPAATKSTVDVQAVLSDLAHETRADVVLFLSDDPKAGVIAQVSTLNSDRVESLAALIRTMMQAAQAAGHFLGQPELPFEHNMFEGQDLRLYVMVVASGALLVAVTPMSTPLGTVRHNLRRASRDLPKVALT
jgi:CheY-like chemotaxis protein